MDSIRVHPETLSGDPIAYAAAHNPLDGVDRPCICNDGWVTMGVEAIDPETGEETIEYALYLCRRCGEEA